MNREIWQQIKGFEGFYSVSNKGNVKHDKTTKRLHTARTNSRGFK